MSTSSKLPPIRRVVTGHDTQQCRQGDHRRAGHQCQERRLGRDLDADLVDRSTPADCAIGKDVEDLGARIIGTPPPENGTASPSSSFRPAIPAACTAPRPSTTWW